MTIKCNKSIAVVAAVLFSFLISPSLFADHVVMDSDISCWVRDSPRIDRRVDAAKIAVATDQRIVTLSIPAIYCNTMITLICGVTADHV